MSAGESSPSGGSPGAGGAVSVAEALQAALESSNPEAVRALDLRGADLTDAKLAGAELGRLDLTEADLTRADLEGANLSGAKLSGARLFEARLTGAELVGADLTGANLTRCSAHRAGFGAAALVGAQLFEADLSAASLSRANLRDADLRCAKLERARIHDADLAGADASRSDLRDAQLDRTRVEGATFDHSDLRGTRFAQTVGFEQASWVGVDDREADFRGAYALRRLIVDENYLNEFRNRGSWEAGLYWLWWITSDCGRSFFRWALWTVVVVLLFAGAYGFVAVDYGDHPTFLSPIYFSVVTLTTLGYGDALPTTVPAQLVVMAQVTVGYIALGGLISILANKMARRGE